MQGEIVAVRTMTKDSSTIVVSGGSASVGYKCRNYKYALRDSDITILPNVNTLQCILNVWNKSESQF